MGDIYADLENYNDVNIVEELKSENRELKIKLEKYSNEMTQLQKDFDKLSSEYKKLEKNYSSLLKTARAEIERKTETIKTLNIEKDMFILKTLQETGKKKVLNINKHTPTPHDHGRTSDMTKGAIKNETQRKETPLEIVQEKKDNRGNSSRTCSMDTFSSISFENKSTSSEEKASRNVDSFAKTKNKENYSKVLEKDDMANRHRSKIVNRRKSVPATSEVRFSSDEETGRFDVESNRKSPSRLESKNHERYLRAPDQTRPHRSRQTNYTNYDTYRDTYRDTYHHVPYQRQRQYSPDRNHHRFPKEYSDNHYLRQDYNQRILRSPPTDKYKRSKSRDRRSKYNQEDNRHSNQHSDMYGVKNKSRHELDEPGSKRLKTEYKHKEAVVTNKHSHERERAIPEKEHLVLHELSSCQSPDYVNIESVSQPHIKEIKNTATTKLDDPRILSKKYVTKNYNNTTTLVTEVSQDMDLKTIEASKWGIERHKIPEALLKPISDRETIKLVNDIHIDVINKGVNESSQSGKIVDNNEAIAENHTKEISKPNESQKKDEKEVIKQSKQVCETVEEPPIDRSEKSSKFKIPKIKKPDKHDKAEEQVKEDICDAECSKSKIKEGKKSLSTKHSKISSKINVKKTTLPLMKHEENNTVEYENINTKCNQIKNNVLENMEVHKAFIEKRQQEILKTIEGDLELSDEASDIIEPTHEKSSRDILKPTIQKNITLNDSTSNITPCVIDNNIEKNPSNASSSRKSSSKDSKESSKRRRTKRTISEHKEITLQECSEDTNKKKLQESTKKSIEKQAIAKQTLTKFSDLFGDSNSLITLDDLGINNVDPQQPPIYTPIYENTQDAVDLSVEDIKKAQGNEKEVNNATITDKAINEEKNKINFSINVTVVNENGENNLDHNDPKNLYENTKGETIASSPNVVKTVVISTGMQSESVPESSTIDSIGSMIQPTVLPILDSNFKKCPLNTIKALATSTPQKCFENVPLLQKDNISSTIDNKSTDDVSMSSNVSNSSICTGNPNDEDIPDVRIFVKRRRKVVKKPA